MSPADAQRGLYSKFIVRHAVAKVLKDDMFVLDLDHDPYALVAVEAWQTTPDGPGDQPANMPNMSLYHVERRDKSLAHRHCLFHILNFSRQYARSLAAIRVYHDQCREQYPALASDLWAKYIQPADQGL